MEIINLFNSQSNLEKNNFYKMGVRRRIFFRGPDIREITTKSNTVYIDDIKITTNSEKQHKKLFLKSKRNKRIYFKNKGEI
jgi:hypothetical protein